jgi:hypothetical protein
LIEDGVGASSRLRQLAEHENKVPNNATQFCIDHYNNLELWTDALSPEFI